ncbi:MAG: hypothetical protein F6J89_19450 [Symploca sp. SIO1C4]|uniref:Uncharacterized protein n=1 Tax=Symploca sp. SIO1C4 TaxID=2607765 RepID=A0A6B3NKG3_9CYAN|nr:hypothetical protein [Symploca sp. SIO1C4]NET04727.1 hypothetical protein [Symploca sp. SIO2B6]NET53489.1 hypothetical protein [Merismopedia sp. SIO2A8]
MTKLFQRLQPSQKFRIGVQEIAQFLNIPKQLIVRVECWQYVIFVHRRDCGGQFISYRKLQKWQNAIACQIQKCSTWQQLRQLWLEMEIDKKRHKKQYSDEPYSFLCQFWEKHWDILWAEQEPTASEFSF